MVDAHLYLRTVVDVDMPPKLGIAVLIYLDYCVEKFVYALPVTADRRDDRHSEQMAQSPCIQPVTLRLKLIVHIEGHHHPQVHVNQLGSEVEIPLKIGCIHHIHHHIRHLLYQILPHIQLLGTIGRKGISTGKVHEDEPVTPVLETPLLGIHSHSAVVPHMLMAS